MKIKEKISGEVAGKVFIACGAVFCIVSAVITKKVTLLSYVCANLLVLGLLFLNFLERRKNSDDCRHN